MAPGAADVIGLDVAVQNQSQKEEKVSIDYKSVPVEEIARAAEVPECFLRKCSVTTPDTETGGRAQLELPVIDLSNYSGGDDVSKAKIRAEVALACEEWGLFQVIRHGASSSVLEEGLDVVRRFFDLPLEKKLKSAMKTGTRNWSGYGRIGQISTGDVGFDWQDSFWHHHPLWHGPADGHEWPDEPADYRQKMTGWEQEIRKIASVLHEILSINLGLPKATDLEDIFTLAPVRTLYYPACPRPTNVLGMNAHTDASSINIVQQLGDVTGLQMLHEGDWMTIRPVTGALVVNIGDCLEIMSNGKYKSVYHRVTVNSKTPRISIVLGFRPNLETVLTPLPHTVDEDHPLRYRSLTFNKYLELRGQAPSLEEAKAHVNANILLSNPHV